MLQLLRKAQLIVRYLNLKFKIVKCNYHDRALVNKSVEQLNRQFKNYSSKAAMDIFNLPVQQFLSSFSKVRFNYSNFVSSNEC